MRCGNCLLPLAVCGLVALSWADGLGDSLTLECQLASRRGGQLLLNGQGPGGDWPDPAATALAVLAVSDTDFDQDESPWQQSLSWLANNFAATEDWASRATVSRALWRSKQEELRQPVRAWLRECHAADWRHQALALSPEAGQYLLELVWLAGAEAGWSPEEAEALADLLDARDAVSPCSLYRNLVKPGATVEGWSHQDAANLQERLTKTASPEEIYWLARTLWAAEMRQLHVPTAWRSLAASRLLELQAGHGGWRMPGEMAANAADYAVPTAYALLAMKPILR